MGRLVVHGYGQAHVGLAGRADLLYVDMTRIAPMSTKTERWTLRVTPMQDAVVRQALRARCCASKTSEPEATCSASVGEVDDERAYFGFAGIEPQSDGLAGRHLDLGSASGLCVTARQVVGLDRPPPA